MLPCGNVLMLRLTIRKLFLYIYFQLPSIGQNNLFQTAINSLFLLPSKRKKKTRIKNKILKNILRFLIYITKLIIMLRIIMWLFYFELTDLNVSRRYLGWFCQLVYWRRVYEAWICPIRNHVCLCPLIISLNVLIRKIKEQLSHFFLEYSSRYNSPRLW